MDSIVKLNKKINALKRKIKQYEETLEQINVDIERLSALPDSPTNRRDLLFRRADQKMTESNIASSKAKILVFEYEIDQQKQIIQQMQ